MEEKEVISIGRNRIVDDGFNFYVDYIGMKEKPMCGGRLTTMNVPLII